MLPNLKIWLNHFEYHAEHPRRITDGISNVLTVTERRLIASSIATFQLGEQSSGGNLLRAAYRFAQEHDAGEVARITELLIREEQQHAALLRSFMAAHRRLRRSRWHTLANDRLTSLTRKRPTCCRRVPKTPADPRGA